ncbi:MAG: RNA polymerase sigma-70 factor [Ignavibacteria bacterium]|nr:RNA polymerase sigma-70 factor [Ignavibacteria bacterium]
MEKSLGTEAKTSNADTMDSGLVERIRAGDEVAFELLFRSYYPLLCRFTFRLIRDSSDGEQLVQDVFLNIWQMREGWSPRSTVRSYLYRAAKNQALNYLKHRRLVGSVDELEVQTAEIARASLQEDYERKELMVAVQQAIELLPPRCKLVFALHRQDGLTYSEIADVLDISVKTVETQIGRALKFLRKILKPYSAVVMTLIHSLKS